MVILFALGLSIFVSSVYADEVRVFKGTIGKDMKVQMQLEIYGEELYGVYFYESQQKDLDLKGLIDDNGSFMLMESYKGENTGKIIGSIKDDKVNATWYNPAGNKQYPVILTEVKLIPLYFNKHLEGTINGNLEVRMTLERNSVGLSGVYYYMGNKGNLYLNGTMKDDGFFELAETDSNDKITGHFKGKISGDILEGQWYSPDGKKQYPFYLKTSDKDPEE